MDQEYNLRTLNPSRSSEIGEVFFALDRIKDKEDETGIECAITEEYHHAGGRTCAVKPLNSALVHLNKPNEFGPRIYNVYRKEFFLIKLKSIMI